MKLFLFIFAVALAAAGCAPNQQAVSQNSNTAAPTPRNERSQTVTAHTTENQTPAPANMKETPAAPGKFASGGEPIDTARFDGTISTAEKLVKSKPADEEAKKALADAYYDRGVALTDARQYAAALGDYRRALKHNPGLSEAQDWINQIVGIYKMLKKDPPKEGEEPPALPFKKA